MIEVKGNTIYTGNTVNDAVVLAAQQLLDCFDEIEVSFDVTGRTCHQLLAHRLYESLDNNTYGAKITYNYGCTIFKKFRITLVTIEVHYTDAKQRPLLHYIKRAFTKQEDAKKFMEQGIAEKPNLKVLLGSLYSEGDKFHAYGDIMIESIALD